MGFFYIILELGWKHLKIPLMNLVMAPRRPAQIHVEYISGGLPLSQQRRSAVFKNLASDKF